MELGITSRMPVATPRASLVPPSLTGAEANKPDQTIQETTQTSKQAPVSSKGLESAMADLVKEANAKIASTSSRESVQFEIDSKTGDTVVRVVDQKTKKIIRQIPPEEVLALQKRMAEMRGLLFDHKG
jgi:flagellar protein FlaG